MIRFFKILPKTSDVGRFLQNLPEKDYLPTWYDQRIQGELGKEEQQTATKPLCMQTPLNITYADTLGRTFTRSTQSH